MTRAPKFSIILAAGKGTRMQSSSCPKVCFPIDGKAAINRAIETYNRCGIQHHVIVVGAMAGQVVETVGAEFSNVSFVYQSAQLGTAHAAEAGLRALQSLEGDPDILLVAGDRIIEDFVLEQLFELYFSQSCHLAFPVTPRREGSTQGRAVEAEEGGVPLAIVEDPDISQRRVFRTLRALLAGGQTPTAARVMEVARAVFGAEGKTPSDKKMQIALGPLWQAAAVDRRDPAPAELASWIPASLTEFAFTKRDGTKLVKTPEQVDASRWANNSIYLVKASALRFVLERLDRNNAQQEKYLSDLVAILAQGRDARGHDFKVRALRVENPDNIMGYNNPAELLQVEAHVQSKKRAQAGAELPDSAWFQPIQAWQESFRAVAAQQTPRAGSGPLRDELVATYSDDASVMDERLAAYRTLLARAAELLGPAEKVLIVRSPGRVNAMGRHIDHQGGNCNLMTISYETLMAVHPRPDDRIRLFNLDQEQFGAREFSIGELVKDLPWDDWMSLVNSEKVMQMVRAQSGEWSRYVMAAVLRLQMKFGHTRLRGMDLVVSGNVPMAAGLSSSSSLVVATAEATIAANRLDTFPAQLIDLCGEGEWFVGTRGGSADHAAVKLGQRGKIIKVTFFSFAVQDVVPFPEDYVLAVCDSGIKARKSAATRDQFNHRIACYRIGFRMILHFFPQFAPLLHHLRDVNVRNLGVPLSWIYKILLHLPEQATPEELAEILPPEELRPFLASHQPPADRLYPIRGVALFGLAECERARLYADCLKRNEIAQIGRLMNASHDGDRAASFAADGTERPYKAPTSNGYLLGLIEDLESGDPERVLGAQLEWQPGRYFCSLPQIDRMVDSALRVDGVVGAQLAGAGLGGCMMVLAHRKSVQALVERLNRDYYAPIGKPPAIMVCKPIAGAGVLLAEPAVS